MVGMILAGCGGVDFSGTYLGNLTTSGSCSDGSPVLDARTVSWIVTEGGGVLTISNGGTCGLLTADASGNSAQFQGQSCPTQTSGGLNFAIAFTGGSLVLNGKSLAVSLNSVVNVSGSSSGTCTAVTSGTLSKQN